MFLHIKTVAFTGLKGRKQYLCGLLRNRQLGVKGYIVNYVVKQLKYWMREKAFYWKAYSTYISAVRYGEAGEISVSQIF